ncbi:MAG: HNH endonuclease [Paludibacter sp.]
MTVSTDRLEVAFADFVSFIKNEKNENFTTFKNLLFLDTPDEGENYKYQVYNEGREKLDSKRWVIEDIGTGKIHDNTTDALKVKSNNLVNDFRLKEKFAQISDIIDIEQILFDFYKSKILDSVSFAKFIDFGIPYNVIAYFFFLKEKNKYLPISQRRFDEIFQIIGIVDFKTDGQKSYDNYINFCDIIKQVQYFLKTKDKETTLIDAHSFLWILGMMNANPVKKTIRTKEKESNIKVIKKEEEKVEIVQSNGTELIKNLTEIRQSEENFYPDDLPTETTEELYEGVKKTVIVNSYERNPKARKLCIEYWEAICAVCSVDFEKIYGEIGKGFIHVHHLTPISKIGETYQVDPINDLIPVCPNCHSMLHRNEPPLTIYDLKKIIKKPISL